MPSIRKNENQLTLVHKERSPDTNSFQQRVLFTFYTKKEALHAIGKGKEDGSSYFQNMLRESFPNIKFNWSALNKSIFENLDVLPDVGNIKEKRLTRPFQNDFFAFTKTLVQTESQMNQPAAQLLEDHKLQLTFLQELIDMKLQTINTEENPFNSENEFYWRTAFQDHEVNSDVVAFASQLYKDEQFGLARAGFELLTNSFPNFAEGHNYLGLIALEANEKKKAVDHFRKTVELGLKKFPKSLSKEHYWLDLNTRPYMRGLKNLILALIRDRQYEEALNHCEVLDKKCGDQLAAASFRASAYLNLKKWSLAEEFASQSMQTVPIEAVVVAFAQMEQEKNAEAVKFFLHSYLCNPLAVEILVKKSEIEPKNFIEAEDHNTGVETFHVIEKYLNASSAKLKKFFYPIMADPKVKSLVKEVRSCAEKQTSCDPKKSRASFERWHELRKVHFAEELANSL